MTDWGSVIGAAIGGGILGAAGKRYLDLGLWKRDGDSPAADAVVARLGPLLAPVSAGVSAAVAWRVSEAGHPYAVPMFVLLFGVLLIACAVDLAVHRLPDRLVLGCAPIVVALALYASSAEDDWHHVETALWSALLAAIAFVILVFGGLGLGDLKVAVLLAFATGWLDLMVALRSALLGFVVGGIWAIVLLVSKRAGRGSHFAFGPALVIGAIISVLAG